MKKIIVIILLILIFLNCHTFHAKKFIDKKEREYFEIVSPIMTKAEKEIYFNLPFSERKAFWHSFWQIRGGKEVMKEYFTRIAFANQFKNEGRPGWKTDRGYVVRLLGIPQSIEFYDNTTAIEDPRTGELFSDDPFWSPFHNHRVRYYIFYYTNIAGYQLLPIYFVEDYSLDITSKYFRYSSKFTNSYHLWQESAQIISTITRAIQEGKARWSPKGIIQYSKLDMKIKKQNSEIVWIVIFKFQDFTFQVIEKGKDKGKLLLLLRADYYIFRKNDGKNLFAGRRDYKIILKNDEKVIKKDKMIQKLFVKGLIEGRRYIFLTKAINLIDSREYFGMKEFKR